ncbi:hypothetical protein ACFWF3_18745 [Nocardia sp. NPDC060220]|uniref:hypothetical protein n=1 Tax=Nocardia sp. NPDC060220 TaxID=3347076 RepID=UPI0036673FF2
MARGPEPDDVEALLRAALALDDRPPASEVGGAGPPVLLLAGSGKKGARTLNVSTPAALVAATAGAKVIKVGSAATSSALGSRDLVRALGVHERRTAEEVRGDLSRTGFSFVAIEPEIPVLDQLYGGRFHAPNPFSMGLAALASPVRGDRMVFGLAHPRVDVAARVLRRFGMADVDVIGTRLPDGRYIDEVGAFGEFRRCRVRDGRLRPVEIETITGIPVSDLPAPVAPEEAIALTGDLLAGAGLDSHRDLVAVNAAHLLVLGEIVTSLAAGIRIANDIIRTGAASKYISEPNKIDRSA